MPEEQVVSGDAAANAGEAVGDAAGSIVDQLGANGLDAASGGS